MATFAAIRCPRRSDDGNIIIGSRPEVYLTDPLLGWLPHFLCPGLPSPDMTRLTEMTVGVTLAHVHDDLDDGRWLAGDTVGYARTDSGNEVDLCPVDATIPAGSERTVPIESKCVDTGWRGEGRVIAGKYNAGVLATKSVLAVSEAVWAVPAPLVCLLLR